MTPLGGELPDLIIHHDRSGLRLKLFADLLDLHCLRLEGLNFRLLLSDGRFQILLPTAWTSPRNSRIDRAMLLSVKIMS